MAEQTREVGPTSDGDRNLERHTGADSLLKVDIEDGGTYEVPISSVTYSRDYTLEEIQHNGSLNATLTTSEIRYSGSFEYNGQDPTIMKQLMHGEDASGSAVIDRNRPKRSTITVREYDHDDGNKVVSTITFRNVMIDTNDRDLTVGDISSTTFDWQAEDMEYVRGTPGG